MSSSINNVKIAAFTTITALAVGTAASVIFAATSVSTVALVAYSILGITGAALSGAAITAYLDKDSVNVNNYFNTFKSHTGYALAISYQFVAQTLVQALVQGLANGISKAVSRKIAGPDHTYRAV